MARGLDASIILAGENVAHQIDAAQQPRMNALRMQALQQDMGTTQQAQREANAVKLARMVLSSPDPASAYPQALQAAQAMGIPTEGMPPQWSPEVGEQLQMVASLLEMPPDQRTEFERLLGGLPPEEQQRAIRVKAGLEPGADAMLRGRMGDAPPSGYRYDETGNLDYIPGGPADPLMRELQRGPGQATEVTLPDGTTVYTGAADGTPSGRPVGRAGQNQLDEMEINAREQMARLQRIEQSAADPILADFGSLNNRLKTMKLSWQDFISSDSLSPEDAEFLVSVTTLRGDIVDNLNRTIKDITGAAMSLPEAERISKQVPTEDDSPTVFRAKMDRVMNSTRAAIARYNLWRNRGLGGKPEDLGTLGDIEQQMEQRRKDLWQAVDAGSMTADEAAAVFYSEFGI